MNLSQIFIERPVMTILVMLSLLFFGIISYDKLPVSDLPNVNYPTIQVSASYPGANPTVMANTVAAPLEQQFLTIQNLISLTSNSTTGNTTINLQFDISRNIDAAAQDVQAAINQASAQLPQNLPYAPTYSKVNPSQSPVMYIAVTSATAPLGTLYQYGQTVIGERISLVQGVAQVQTFGSPFAVRIQVDPQKLTAKNLAIDEFASAIKNANVQNPVGTLYGPTQEFTIDVDGQISVGDKYNALIVKTENDGSIVRVSDVGRAFDSTSFDKYYLRYRDAENNLPCVVLGIQTQPGVNSLAVINGIKTLLPKIKKEIPGSVQLHIVFDKSVYIDEAVRDVQMTLIIALILVVIVIFIYLGKPRDTLIPSLALPVSIIGTFGIMGLLGYSIDVLSLLAITLCIGFLVDDAIVVLENIVRHVEKGELPHEAALKGSKEISFTIVSMTLCLVAVFIPLLFMGGVLGKLFREFSVVIFSAVLLSGFVSLSLTPMLCSKFVPPKKEGAKKGKTELLSEKFNAFLVNLYKPSLEWAVHHRMTILIIGACSLGATIFMMKALPKDFLPNDDIGFIQGFSQAPDGTSPFLMNEYQQKINNAIFSNPAIHTVVSLGAIPTDNQGLMFIHLKPFNKRQPIAKVMSELYHQLRPIPGAQVFLRAYPLINLEVGTSSIKGDYQYTLQSLDQEALFKSAEKLIDQIKALPGFADVGSDLLIKQPQLHLSINRDRASMLGVSAFEIENTLNLAFADSNLSPINLPQNQYYVIMETLPQFYKDPLALKQLYVRSNNGNLVPLSEVVTPSQTLGPLSVNHIDGLPSVTITFNLKNTALGPALDRLDKLAKKNLPTAVSGDVVGTANVFQQAFADLRFLLMITIFIIYVVLGILYENFFHPLTVMSTLPPAALGAFISLYLTGHPISLYAFVGIILLLGIVLKNGIIMVDFANDAVDKKGMSPHDAIIYAATTRFRPILMTTLSALMGALPIALGFGGLTALSRTPLGIVIVGGLLFSQVLTLYFTPVTYILIEQLREKYFPSKRSSELKS